jgi:hypothetical protein
MDTNKTLVNFIYFGPNHYSNLDRIIVNYPSPWRLYMGGGILFKLWITKMFIFNVIGFHHRHRKYEFPLKDGSRPEINHTLKGYIKFRWEFGNKEL